MSQQSTLWLYPLVLMSVFALVLYIRIGLSWTWGFSLQALAILAVALLGFIFNQMSWLFALSGWGLFGLFVVLPRRIVSRLERDLNLLRPDQALREAKLLRLFFWGDPGRFWEEMAFSMQLFLESKPVEAEALIERWRAKKIPRSTRDGLESFHLTGLSLLRDWSSIIAEYNRLKEQGGKIPYNASMSACRAYLELGLVAEAESCLAACNIGELKLTNETVSLVFLPFFALAGASGELDKVIADLATGRSALPPYAVLCWRGRCLAAQGKIAESERTLAEALSLTTPEMTAWRERIQYQLNMLKGKDKVVPAQDWSGAVARAAHMLASARLVADIVNPEKPTVAVICLTSLISVAYVVSHAFEWVKAPLAVYVGTFCFNMGILEAHAVEAGEYWRLISYLFLHSHVSHLALNLIGLWWFGRLAENLYGTGRFLVIYFSCGILSGVWHILLSPTLPAVGASGAIMGVFGAATAGIFRSKDILPENIRRTEVSWMLGLMVAQVLLDQLIPHVATFAHLGGLVAGLTIGLVIPMRRRPKSPQDS